MDDFWILPWRAAFPCVQMKCLIFGWVCMTWWIVWMTCFTILIRCKASAIQWSLTRWRHLKAIQWSDARCTANWIRWILNRIIVEIFNKLMLRRTRTPWWISNRVCSARCITLTRVLRWWNQAIEQKRKMLIDCIQCEIFISKIRYFWWLDKPEPAHCAAVARRIEPGLFGT